MSFIRASILVVISVLVVALVYGSFSAFHESTFYVFAAKKVPGYTLGDNRVCWDSDNTAGQIWETCCWTEPATEQFGIMFCQECMLHSFDYCLRPETVYPVIEQPPTPPVGGKGPLGANIIPTPSISPDDGGVVEQPPITTPTAPIAPPTEPPAPTSEPTVPPETGQGEEDGTGGSGGIKPPVKDLLPDTGITEQPDVQQPEQDQPSNEGQDTGGPLT